jgi:hypothetical protein
MTHAIRIHKTGGPEVLSWEEVQLGKPGPGEARIRHNDPSSFPSSFSHIAWSKKARSGHSKSS